MLECDITYEINKLEEFFDEQKITEFSDFIVKDEYGEEYDKTIYPCLLQIIKS